MFGQLDQGLLGNFCFRLFSRVFALNTCPLCLKADICLWLGLSFESLIKALGYFVCLFCNGLRLDAGLDEAFSINLVQRRSFADFVVHEWLSEKRLISFVMTMTTIADHFDYHIFSEFLTILQSQTGDISGGFRILTRPIYAPWIRRLKRRDREARLTPAALETLAIVAYRQPVLRADVEKIRGVDVGGSMRTLIERGLLKVVGRAEEPGSPMLYGTTKRFLSVFGLKSLKDLPKGQELREPR